MHFHVFPGALSQKKQIRYFGIFALKSQKKKFLSSDPPNATTQPWISGEKIIP